MRIGFVAALLALLCTATFRAPSAYAEGLNGPMSSNRKQESAVVAPESVPTQEPKAGFDAEKLFASTCGWCHSGGGRVAGKGPKLMDTTLTDAEIVHRIKVGKTGAMPAFGTAFNEVELQAIVSYIRGLHEEIPAK